MKTLFVRIVSALLCLSIAACSTMRNVPDWCAADDPAQRLQVGDLVRVQTNLGDEQTLVVTAIEPDALVGQPAGSAALLRIPFDDIVRVDRKEFDGGTTAGWVGGALIVGLIVLFYVALSHAAFFPAGPS